MATYYVSSSIGNDSNNGTSQTTPWKTLSKVASKIFVAGDSVLFKNGDVFIGNLKIPSSGTSSNSIVFGNYGLGPSPIISGLKTIAGWTNQGGGIWSITDTTLGGVQFILVNGNLQQIGRFPKSGYNTYGSATSTSIHDSSLTTSFIGGQVVLKNNHFNLSNYAITGESSGTLSFASNGANPTNGYGYFIQNHINCLTQFGDWCFNSSTHTLSFYFGSNSPSSYTIQVPAYDQLINFNGKSYVTIQNLVITGATNSGIYSTSTSASNNIVRNCTISYCGGYGANYYGAISPSILNCTFNNNLSCSILFNSCTGSPSISGNSVFNTGIIPGMGAGLGTTNAFGAYCGIYSYNSPTLVQNNTVMRSGYNGIVVRGEGFICNENYVDTCCTVLDDGGCIYTDIGFTPIVYTGRTISNNIVCNAIGSPQGTADGKNQACGIYQDDNTSNLTTSGNTAFNCGQYGFFLHNNHEVTFTNNFGFNNGVSQLSLVHDGIALSALPRNINISGNLMVAAASTQLCVQMLWGASNSTSGDFTGFGTSDNNTYGNLSSNTNVFKTQLYGQSAVVGNLSSWQTITNQEADSVFTIPSYLATKFDFNNTLSNQNIDLVGTYVDFLGSSYSTSYNLNSYTAKLLLLRVQGGGGSGGTTGGNTGNGGVPLSTVIVKRKIILV